MNTAGFDIKLQNEGVRNYLVIGLPQDTEMIPYCMNMLEKTKVPGLLPLSYQLLNGEARLRYAVSGRLSLRDFLRTGNVDRRMGMLLLRNLTFALQSLNAYFIGTEKLLLDPQYLYIGDGIQVFLPCVPTDRNVSDNVQEDLRKFYQDILSKYLGAGNSYYNDMFMWIYNQENFDLTTYADKFLKDTAAAPQAPVRPAGQQAAAPAPAAAGISSNHPVSPMPRRQPEPQQVQIPTPAAVPQTPPAREVKRPQNAAVPNAGARVGVMQTADGRKLNIPGMGAAAPMPVQPQPEKPKKKGFGLFEKKKAGNVKNAIRPYLVYHGEQFYIEKFPFMMGRGGAERQADFVVQDNPRVSHQHAVISFARGKYYLRDNDSKNGSFLNGQHILPGTQHELQDGDEIRLFDEIVRFYLM